MLFVDIPFPSRIAFGAKSEPEWSTTIVASFGGGEIENQNWEDVRHSYDVSFAVRNVTDYREVKAHFMQVRGRAKAFPFKDFLDFTATGEEGITEETSDGWQLLKRYGGETTDMLDVYDRRITRPRVDTLKITRTRSGTPSDVTSACTFDAGGMFSVTGDTAGDVYTWTGEFDVPCRYGVDKLPAVAINKEPGEHGELLVTCDAIPLVEVLE
jgi:uncharacterized protein (TIGR02217 family)